MTTPLIYVCLDGLGDDPIPELDGRTPLEAAETPNLDALASRGRTGTVLTVGPASSGSSATTRSTSTRVAGCSRRSGSAWSSTTAISRTA